MKHSIKSMVRKVTPKKLFAVLLIIVLQGTSLPVVVLAQEASDAAALQMETREDVLPGLDVASHMPATDSAGVDPVLSPVLSDDQAHDEAVLPAFTNADTAVSSAVVRKIKRVRSLSKRTFKADERVSLIIDNATDGEISAVVFNEAGEIVDIPILTFFSGDTKVLRLLPPDSFVPGKYTVRVNDGTTEIAKQDFTWGVLAVNTNKSIYLPGEQAKLSLAVLDDKGEMVCDANITLRITNNKGGTTDTLSTGNGKITVNPECRVKAFTLNPDYEAEYTVSKSGIYEMSLTAVTKKGSYSISDSFLVKDSVPFDVEREAATRLYPPEIYPVAVTITAQKDFRGVITEAVPDSFEISQNPGTKQYSKVRSVSEEVLLKEDVLGASTKLPLPFSEEHKLTAAFGIKHDDKKIQRKYEENGVAGHDGVDFDMRIGTPVLSVDTGKVVLAEAAGDYGTTVVIEHAWGKSYYGHLSKILLKKGDSVKRGEKIALSGNSGLSTAPHLHFGIKPWKNDIQNGYFGKVDPLTYIDYTEKGEVLAAAVSHETDVKVIAWEVALKKGEKVTLGYQFKAPEISPQFYTIGPLRFYEGKGVIFQEERVWQIAVDATENKWATSHLTGDAVSPNNALGTSDGTWAGIVNANTSWTSRWAMDDPSGAISGTQTISVLARKGSNSGTPTLAINLYENGSSVQSIVGATNVTSTTGQTISGTFDTSAITNSNNVEIEVVVSAAGGNPSTRNSAQIDEIKWTVELDQSPPTTALNAPTDASTAFDTTPTLDFTGTDAQAESIEYNVQIDTEDTFASPLLDKLSVTPDAGFVNPDTGGDTHPFNSGENIQYTVQAGDVLANGTYYWRVRGIDPTGSNTYGAWGTTRSFTITSPPTFTQSGYRFFDNPSGGGTTAGPTNIDNASDFGDVDGSGRQIVRTSSGTLYAVVKDGNDLEVWKSSDGSSWSMADSLTATTSVGEMAVGIDSNDDLHIIYTDSTNFPYVKHTTSTDTLGSIESTCTVALAGGGVSLSLDSNDVPHIAMHDAGGSSLLYTNRVGGAWNSCVTVEITAGGRPDIVINEDNIPEISYINAAASDLTAAVGNVNNATSFTLQDVDTNIITIAGTGSTSIAVDSSGNTWIGYVDDFTGENLISLAKHNDADAWTTWQSQINNSGITGAEPSIAVNGTTVYIFYQSDGFSDVVYDRYNGSWLGETPLQTGTFQDIKAKWSLYNNNGGDTQIDYLYSDGTDVYWATLGVGTPPTDVGSTLADTNTAATAPAQGTGFRLRLLLHVATSQLGSSGQVFKLQVAPKSGSCAASTYTDLSGTSGAIRYDNRSAADNASLIDNANDPAHSSDTIVNQTYNDADGAASDTFTNSVAAIPAGQDGLWDFALVDHSASADTTYCFRAVTSGDTTLDTYTVFPEITTATPPYTQNDFRFYENANNSAATPAHVQSKSTVPLSATPSITFDTTPTAGNTIIVAVTTYDNLEPTVSDNKGNTYTPIIVASTLSCRGILYYAKNISSSATFTVSVAGGSTGGTSLYAGEYSGLDTVSPLSQQNATNGSSTTISTGSVTTTNDNELFVGLGGHCDTARSYNNAQSPWTQRVNLPDGSVNAPILVADKIGNAQTTSLSWNEKDTNSAEWFGAIATFKPSASINLGSALANENAAASLSSTTEPIRLRMNLTMNDAMTADSQQFKLQYGTSTAGPWSDVGDAVWDFYDNTTGNDGETVTSTVLTASDVRETYEEDNPTVTNPNSASVGQDAEWDFALDPANATTTTYYFRIVTSDGEPLTSYSSYPTVTIGAGGGGISLDQLMRHGKWFDNGVRQPFTF